jgi:dipeptide/tripeptide permease
MAELPSYLTDELGFDLSTSGILCMIPYIVLCLMGIAFGKLFSYLEHVRRWKIRSIRQCAQFVALGGPALFLIICGLVPKSNKWLSFSLMILANGLLGATPSGLGCAFMDIAPNFSSPLNTLGNCAGAVAGIIGPLICSALINELGQDDGYHYYLTNLISISLFNSLSIFHINLLTRLDGNVYINSNNMCNLLNNMGKISNVHNCSRIK